MFDVISKKIERRKKKETKRNMEPYKLLVLKSSDFEGLFLPSLLNNKRA